MYKNVPVLDTGARGATTTFVQRGIGDVLLTWENEAYLALREFGGDRFEIVNPSVSILAEPPVALVARIAEKHGTTEIAGEYLRHLYSPEGQKIIAKHFYRPFAAAKGTQAGALPPIPLFTIGELFGGWDRAHATHFSDGGTFDRIYNK